MQQNSTKPSGGMSLTDGQGLRKYLTPAERKTFLEAAGVSDRMVRTFCEVLAHGGCRLREAVELTADRVDLKAGYVTFETLKKRKRGIFRQVPVPPAFLDTLDMVHAIRTAQRRPDRGKGVRLWPWSLVSAWRRVKVVMKAAGIQGPHATPKGLRHGFGIRAVTRGVPLNKVQKWMGHAQLSTTSIYTDAIGEEEQQLAERMWTDD
jgi:integrase/recombinase XerD